MSGRKRQRSLRVPVDDVPRAAPETTEDSTEIEMLVEPEPEVVRPRSVRPPPPAPPPPAERRLEVAAEPARGARAASGEPDEAEPRTTDPGMTDPGQTSAPDELAAHELGAPMAIDAPMSELDGEPTHVASEPMPRRAMAMADPESEIPGEPTREIVLADDEIEADAPVEPAAAVARTPSAPPPKPTSTSSRPPPRPLTVPPPSAFVGVEEPAPAPSSPGVIVLQRAIAIGVGAPTHTTTAAERNSAPPPPAIVRSSEPPVAALADVDIETPPLADAPAPAGREEFDDDVAADEIAADEFEESSSPGIALPPTPSRKPPAPAAAAPPPAPSGATPAAPSAAGAPPPPPTGGRPPPKPPERRAPAGPGAAAAASAAASPAAAAASATESDTTKRARRKWWEDLFNDDYLRTVPIPHPKVILRQTDFIESRLGLAPGATVLDAGCGLGLHAIELTRRGHFLVGLDLSLPMLSRAADEARDEGLKINFVQGDMREMNFDGAFDAVVSWGTSFGYFDDDANRAVVERFHRALKPGGLLLLDVVNRDYVLRNTPNNCWFQGDGCIVMEETLLNFITSRLTVKRQVMLDDGRQLDTGYSIRLYSLHELGQILHQRGFRVVEVSGLEATPGVFFGAESPRLLIVAERRPDAPTSPHKRVTDPGETGPHDPVSGSETPAADPPPAPSSNGNGGADSH